MSTRKLDEIVGAIEDHEYAHALTLAREFRESAHEGHAIHDEDGRPWVWQREPFGEAAPAILIIDRSQP